jgi:proteasome lid subunit RPN8/RPN11
MVLLISKENFKKILKHCEEVYPIEACGMLGGVKIGNSKIVKKVYEATNAFNSSRRYQIHPIEEYEILRDIEKSELELVGIYHSHPFWPAFLSSIDEETFSWPECSYVIVSLKNKEVKSFILDKNGKFLEEKIEFY